MFTNICNVVILKQLLTLIINFQVLQRIDDVWLMCENYTATLKKLAAKSMRPVQQVIPEPAVPIQSGSPLVIRRTKNQQVS